MLASLPASLVRRSLLLRHSLRPNSMTIASSAQDAVPQPAAKMQRTEPPSESLRVRRLNEHALLPKRGSAGAAGYDLAR